MFWQRQEHAGQACGGGAGIEGLDDLFAGPTAIAFVQGEAVDAAKVIKKFAKDHKALVIKGGYMDGHPLFVAEVERIADLESREVLLAKLAGAMKGNSVKATPVLPHRRWPDWPLHCRRRSPARPPPNHPNHTHVTRKAPPWQSSAPRNCSTRSRK